MATYWLLSIEWHRYPELMLARALVLLDAAHVNIPDLDMTAHESVEVTGEGADWVSAKNACQIPDGGLLLAWFRES